MALTHWYPKSCGSFVLLPFHIWNLQCGLLQQNNYILCDVIISWCGGMKTRCSVSVHHHPFLLSFGIQMQCIHTPFMWAFNKDSFQARPFLLLLLSVQLNHHESSETLTFPLSLFCPEFATFVSTQVFVVIAHMFI